MTDEKKSPRQEIADSFVANLTGQNTPFNTTIGPGEIPPPINAASGRAFSGINRVILSAAGETDPRWLTKNQAEEQGYQIKDMAKPRQLVFWDAKKGDRPVMRHYAVYHANDLSAADGRDLPPYEPPAPERPLEEQLEAILAESGAKITHSSAQKPRYDQRRDVIQLPPKDKTEALDYYSQALRLVVQRAAMRNQTETQPPTPEQESQEKLTVHLAAFIAAQDVGAKFIPNADQRTVKGWRDQLANNPDLLFQAAKQAEKLRAQVLGQEKAVERRAEPEAGQAAPEPAPERVILQVPYAEKDQAKAAGAKWDRENKFWVAEAGADLSKLSQWLPENEPNPSPNLTPEQEFAQTLATAGFKLDGPPIMDGSIQRTAVEGGRPQAKDGVYQTRLEGTRPNGWFKNHKTGHYQAWMFSGQTLSSETKKEMRQSQSDERKAALEQAEKKAYARWMNGVDVEKEFAGQVEDMVPLSELLKNPYLEVAGVNPYGVRRDEEGNLMIPAVSPEGHLKNIQTISPIGEATFEKGCRREGVMCLIDSGRDISETGRHGFAQLKKEVENDHERSILIAEDYAAGASLHMATGKPVAVAFYPANLISVAKTMRQRFPEANLVVCANNAPGRYLNNSLMQAVEAATEARASLIKPTFSDTEKAQGLASFNDLHKYYGLETVAKELAPALSKRPEQKADQGLGR